MKLTLIFFSHKKRRQKQTNDLLLDNIELLEVYRVYLITTLYGHHLSYSLSSNKTWVHLIFYTSTLFFNQTRHTQNKIWLESCGLMFDKNLKTSLPQEGMPGTVVQHEKQRELREKGMKKRTGEILSQARVTKYESEQNTMTRNPFQDVSLKSLLNTLEQEKMPLVSGSSLTQSS